MAFGHACTEVDRRVLAYRLIPNHFHLVLWPHADGGGSGSTGAYSAQLVRGAPFGDATWQIETAARLGLGATLGPPGRPKKSNA